ncbi:hypothetical protein [Anabaena sp. CCY 9910]|uniref:hypothetical protein n=1 Tax=Anabaena sp. CCY 9910 TaxID=3103870 RepID=UPI0039E0974B
MLKLPFKTLPQEFEKVTVGNARIGELSIPKYGDLSPNERIYIKNSGLVDLRKAAVDLAKDIAAKSGLSAIAVYNALTAGDSNTLKEFLSEFIEFQDLMEENAAKRNIVLATTIIKFRVLPEWEIENTQDAAQIPPLLVDAVAEFAKSEESGWVEETEVTETSEEGLGNSVNPESQTGEKSTGGVEDTGHKKKGFAP